VARGSESGLPLSAVAPGDGQAPGEHPGVSRTFTALGLDPYSLKKRAEAVFTQPQTRSLNFVELTPPALVGKQCRLELNNGAGDIMRVHRVAHDAADVEVLSRSFWNDL
jgi:hypothetical protein